MVEAQNGLQFRLINRARADDFGRGALIHADAQTDGLFQITAQLHIVFFSGIRIQMVLNQPPSGISPAHVSSKTEPSQREGRIGGNDVSIDVFLCDAFSPAANAAIKGAQNAAKSHGDCQVQRCIPALYQYALIFQLGDFQQR